MILFFSSVLSSLITSQCCTYVNVNDKYNIRAKTREKNENLKTMQSISCDFSHFTCKNIILSFLFVFLLFFIWDCCSSIFLQHNFFCLRLLFFASYYSLLSLSSTLLTHTHTYIIYTILQTVCDMLYSWDTNKLKTHKKKQKNKFLAHWRRHVIWSQKM